MIKNYKYVSPFKVFISFHKLIEELEQIATSDVDYRSYYAKGLLKQVAHKPEFISGIDQLEYLKENETLIQHLLADLFPTALTHNEIKAVTLPFHDFTFNYTERFKKILKTVDISIDMSIRDMDEQQFYIMNCMLILNAYYHQNIDIGKPLFYDIPDENGVLRHYRILYNADFLEISPTENTSFLSESDIHNLLDHYEDFALWKKAFPENSWVLKGFAIVSLVDVTTESAVSNLKSNLLKSDIEKSELNESFESIFSSVFKIPDLKIGFTFYDEEEHSFKKPPFSDSNLQSFILLNEETAACEKALCSASFESVIEHDKPFVISNVPEYVTQQKTDTLAAQLHQQNIGSFLIAPVSKAGKLLGVIELASPTIRALNSVSANKLELILPYLTDTIDKYNIDMSNQLEAIIQKEYTAIHPSVYWKFKNEAKNYLYSNIAQEAYNFKEIVFKEVFPLYGQIDIKGSSENRVLAVVSDLKEQLYQIIHILKLQLSTQKITVIEQKIFELEGFLQDLAHPFQNNLEQTIHHYIETEIHSFLKNTEFDPITNEFVTTYFDAIDTKTGLFYHKRKDFDDTITRINKKLASLLDAKQAQAQTIFPHYYERFKTDGVEHNLYIGASIFPTKQYDTMYLHNLRLWQLETLCEMEMEHHTLKATLPYALDVTSLILAFSSPISIRFRMDEKRFDVDGSYNARYEVVKKRIDKAYVKNTNERITQKEKITIVYSNTSEEKEYLKYIKYLQHKNVLEAEIEKLDIEDLQAVSGLKALRVKVKHQEVNLVVEAEQFITKLFTENLNASYSYHNLEHTQKVVTAIEKLCQEEQVAIADKNKLLLAGWFHDAGYVSGCEDHEEKSCAIWKDFLKNKSISDNLEKEVCDLILATSYQAKPKNKWEQLIKDADTVHLSFEEYSNSLHNLRSEWESILHKTYSDTDWLLLNVDFLQKHQYFTPFAQKEWENNKSQNLKKMKQKLQTIA